MRPPRLVLASLFLFSAITVQGQTDLSVTKTASPPVVQAGDNITYTIAVTNVGTSDNQITTVNDQIPANTTYVGHNDGGGTAFECFDPALNAGNFRCTTTNPMSPGETWTITLVVRVDPGAAGATITNTATASSFPADPNTANDSGTAVTPVSAAPPTTADVSVSKGLLSDFGFVGQGEVATFAIEVRNDGPLAAANVTLTDIVPAQTTFESLTQTSGPMFGCTTPLQGATGTVSCAIASLADQATATFDLAVRLDANATGTITNTATVSTTTPDPDANNNAASASVPATNPGADLRITKTASPPVVAAGSDITYTIEAANIGSQLATDVNISDFVPANTTFVGAFLNGGGSAGECFPPQLTINGDVRCRLTALSPQASRSFTIIVRVDPGAAGQTITNTATGTSAPVDPDTSNNSSTVQTPVSAVPPTDADVSVSKELPAGELAFVGPNEIATYSITVRNDGPLAAVNLTLSDTVPAGTTFDSFAQNSGPSFNCTQPAQGATGTVTCSIASLADQATATFTMTVRANANATGTITNTATVTSLTPDPNTANNTSSTAVTVTESTGADLRLTKTADPTIAAPGTNITYTLTVTNIGSEFAANVSITDPIPANTTFVSVVEPPGTGAECFPPIATNNVRCVAGGLMPLQSFTMTFVVRVNDDATGTITNTAQAESNSTDPVLLNNTADAVTTIDAEASAEDIPLLDPGALLLLAIALAIAGAAVTTTR